MTKEEHRQFRADLFRHLDGIVTSPVAYSLYKHGVLAAILESGQVRLEELHPSANQGYLNVALRVLASQGWLEYNITQQDHVEVSCNQQSATAFTRCALYQDVVQLMDFSGKFHPRKFEVEPFHKMERLFKKFKSRFDLEVSNDTSEEQVNLQVLKHIEGAIVGPTVVALGMGGMFHKYFMEASFRPEEFHQDPQSFEHLLDIFVFLRWFNKNNGNYNFTQKGLFYAKRASAYGVTVSYIPMFRKIDELLFGNPKVLWNVPVGAKELHVDREMNVWGSGGAHATYFKKIDDIIINIFNKPIEQQPKGIVDMGCGNGAFLIHLFEVIQNRTLRGSLLEEYPLFLVGVDFNQAALKVTRANLVQADIWAKVIWGDIGKPEVLEQTLDENYHIKLQDLLQVRTFLDHNRVWESPVNWSARASSKSTGAFAFRGARLSNKQVEENLKQHLLKWVPYIKEFGLLLIELHTIPPEIAAKHLGDTAATAYDATHGFSDQYIIEMQVFHQVAEECGLHSDPQQFARFPDSELATVSINLLKPNENSSLDLES